MGNAPAPSASSPILNYTKRKQWYRWLEKHFASESEAWLLYAKQESGKPRISYNDAVEVALCFDWIDSIIRTHDPQHSMQRFTPRKSGAGGFTGATVRAYSRANIERLRWLYDQGLLHPSVTGKAKQLIELEYRFPADIIAEIKRDREAWQQYQRLSAGYQRIRIAYIDAARRRPEEFKKRLANFVSKTRQGKLIRGYGGIEKHY